MPTAVLMVDSIWIWILSDDTIVTFAPRREKEKNVPKHFKNYEADPIISLLHSLNKERRWEINDPFDLVALLIYYCVDSMLKGSVDSNVQVLRAFEGFASDKINDMTATYKKFRKFQQNEQTRFDIGDDLNNTIELRDITDEIDILLKLIDQQRELVVNMKKNYDEEIIKNENRGLKGTAFLKLAINRLDTYKKQLNQLRESTSQARTSYTDLITLKEAHSGVREAQVATEQARIVNIFTLVTIIFSPLSFFSGIFGMVSPTPMALLTSSLLDCHSACLLSCCTCRNVPASSPNHPIQIPR